MSRQPHSAPPLDTWLARWAPGIAERRAVARHNVNIMAAWTDRPGLAGGQESRKRKMQSGNRSRAMDEDSLTSYTLQNAQLEAMDLYRNQPLAKSAVDVVRRYLGHSRPTATTAAFFDKGTTNRTAAERWDVLATDNFNGWFWNRADYQRRPGVTFGVHQDFLSNMWYTQGDMAFIWAGDGFMPIEGIQICTPEKLQKQDNVKYGFRYDGRGRATHMYWCEWGNSGLIDRKAFHRVPMASVIFCPLHWRPAQTRSLPQLHSCIDAFRDFEECHEYTMLKVKNEAMDFTVERAGIRRPGGRILDNSDGTKTEVENREWGRHVKVNGDPADFSRLNGATPNAQYTALMDMDMHILAAGIGMPYEILLHVYTSGSYTANRAARTDFKMTIQEKWQHRINVHCQRAWNVVTADSIRKGMLPPSPVDDRGIALFNRVSWSAPYMPQIDEAKEEGGKTKAWDNMSANLNDWARSQGKTRVELLDDRARDLSDIQKRAEEIGVTVKEFAPGLVPKVFEVTTGGGG